VGLGSIVTGYWMVWKVCILDTGMSPPVGVGHMVWMCMGDFLGDVGDVM